MKHNRTAYIIGLAAIICMPVAQASVIINSSHTFDWLQYQNVNTTLQDNQLASVASIQWELRKGTLTPPSSSIMPEAEWEENVPLEGVLGSSACVIATEFQVFPNISNTEVDYTLKIQSLPGRSLSDMILAIGGLDYNSRITISCHNSGGFGGAVEWIGSSAWTNLGLGVNYDQAVSWNAGTSELETISSVSGSSVFMFFRLPSSPVDRLDLLFSDPGSPPFGDAFRIGLAATTVPEPRSMLLCAIGACLFFPRRRFSACATLPPPA